MATTTDKPTETKKRTRSPAIHAASIHTRLASVESTIATAENTLREKRKARAELLTELEQAPAEVRQHFTSLRGASIKATEPTTNAPAGE